MAKPGGAACALCLEVDELEVMLPVTIEETPTRDAFQRAFCSDCVTAIMQAMAHSDRWGGAEAKDEPNGAAAPSPGPGEILPEDVDLASLENGDGRGPSIMTPADEAREGRLAREMNGESEERAKRKRQKGKTPFFDGSGSHKK